MKRKASFIEGFKILSASVGNKNDDCQSSQEPDTDSVEKLAGLLQGVADDQPQRVVQDVADVPGVCTAVVPAAVDPPRPAEDQTHLLGAPAPQKQQTHMYIINIMVRGVLTNNVADIWIKTLLRHFAAGVKTGFKVKAGKQFAATPFNANSTNILVVDRACPVDKFLGWCKCRDTHAWNSLCAGTVLVAHTYGYEVMNYLRNRQGPLTACVAQFLDPFSPLCCTHSHPLSVQLNMGPSDPNHAANKGTDMQPPTEVIAVVAPPVAVATATSGRELNVARYACYNREGSVAPSSSSSSSSSGNICAGSASGSSDIPDLSIVSLPLANVNLNKHITDVLDDMVRVYTAKGDDYRTVSYKRVSDILKKKSTRLESLSELDGVKGLGPSLRAKITEIMSTGSLKKLKCFQEDPRSAAVAELANIHGVGTKTAEKLYKSGYRSVADLRSKLAEGGPSALDGILLASSKVGLELYEEFLTRIPRAEMDLLYETVHTHAMALWPDCDCIVGGSYRRGARDSGDIDIIVFPTRGPDSSVPPASIDVVALLRSLVRSGFLTHHLSRPKGSGLRVGCAQRTCSEGIAVTADEVEEGSDDDAENDVDQDVNSEPMDGNSRRRRGYYGVCKLPHPGATHRRIDIITFPRSQYAFAMLQWTGNDHFNRSMRKLAQDLGYKLTDTGLTKCTRDRGNNMSSEGACLPCVEEKDVFDILGLPYLEPHQRTALR